MATNHCRKLLKAVRLFALDIGKRFSNLIDVGLEVSVELLINDEVKDRENYEIGARDDNRDKGRQSKCGSSGNFSPADQSGTPTLLRSE